MRNQRGTRRNAQPLQLLGGQHRDFGDLLGGWIEIDHRVDQRELPPRHHQNVHRGVNVRTGAAADHLIDIRQVRTVRAERAADHAVGLVLVHHHRANQRQSAPHFYFRVLLRHSFARSEAVIRFPVAAISLVELRIDQIEVHARVACATRSARDACR